MKSQKKLIQNQIVYKFVFKYLFPSLKALWKMDANLKLVLIDYDTFCYNIFMWLLTEQGDNWFAFHLFICTEVTAKYAG